MCPPGRLGAPARGRGRLGAIPSAAHARPLIAHVAPENSPLGLGRNPAPARVGAELSQTPESPLEGAFGYGQVASGAKATRGTTTLYRAVGPAELAYIQKTGKLVNLGSAEGKYFTTQAEAASSYARQAVRGFGDPPYTMVSTEISSSAITPVMRATVDRCACSRRPRRALAGARASGAHEHADTGAVEVTIPHS